MDRLLRGFVVLLISAVAAGAVGWLLFIARHPGYGGAADCRAAYHRARSAADSGIVDARVPVVGRPKEPSVLTCGALRRSGELR